MSNGTENPSFVFTPRTIESFERATAALLARFAEPVRALGVRTLRFSDRILGHRLGAPMWLTAPAVPSFKAESNAGGLLFARPWYEVAAGEAKPVSRRVPGAVADLATIAAPGAVTAPALEELAPAGAPFDVASSAAGSSVMAERGAAIERVPIAALDERGRQPQTATVDASRSASPRLDEAARVAPAAPTSNVGPAPRIAESAPSASVAATPPSVPAAPGASAAVSSPTVEVSSRGDVTSAPARSASASEPAPVTPPSVATTPVTPAVSDVAASSAAAPTEPAISRSDAPTRGAAASIATTPTDSSAATASVAGAPLRGAAADPSSARSPSDLAASGVVSAATPAATGAAQPERAAAPSSFVGRTSRAAAGEVGRAPSSTAPATAPGATANADVRVADFVRSMAGSVGARPAGLPATLFGVDQPTFAGTPPLARALSHVAWADAQLGHVAPGERATPNVASFELIHPDDAAEGPFSMAAAIRGGMVRPSEAATGDAPGSRPLSGPPTMTVVAPDGSAAAAGRSPTPSIGAPIAVERASTSAPAPMMSGDGVQREVVLSSPPTAATPTPALPTAAAPTTGVPAGVPAPPSDIAGAAGVVSTPTAAGVTAPAVPATVVEPPTVSAGTRPAVEPTAERAPHGSVLTVGASVDAPPAGDVGTPVHVATTSGALATSGPTSAADEGRVSHSTLPPGADISVGMTSATTATSPGRATAARPTVVPAPRPEQTYSARAASVLDAMGSLVRPELAAELRRAVGAATPGADAAGASTRLPDVRLPTAMASVGATESTIARFLDGLAGTRASADSRALPIELPRAPDLRSTSSPSAPSLTPVRGADAADRFGSMATPLPGDSPAGRAPLSTSARAPELTVVVPPQAPGAAPRAATRNDAAAPSADRATPRRAGAADGVTSPAARASAATPELGERIASGDSTVAAALLSVLRPGGIGARIEQAAGLIGIRAAGMSIDFLDPEQAGPLTAWLSSITSAGARANSTASSSSAPFERLRSGAMPEYVAPLASQGVPGRPAGAVAAVGAVHGAAAPGRTGVDATSQPADGATYAPSTTSFEGVTPPVAVAPSAAAREAVLAQRLDAVWSLLRVFPQAAPGVLAQLHAELAAVGSNPSSPPSGSSELVGPAAGPASVALGRMSVIAGGATRSADGQGVGPLAGTAFTVVEGGAARPSARALAAVGATSTFVAPPTVGAADRPTLPDGRRPRGSYTWTRAADFADQFVEWTPPATVSAATSGADAAATGQPAWGGMTPVDVQAVRDSFTADAAEPTRMDGRAAAAPTQRGQLIAAGRADGRPLPVVAPAGRSSAARRGYPQHLGELAPLLRLVEGTDGPSSSSVSSSSSSGSAASPSARSFMPPSLALIQPAAVAATPVSDASARIVDAVRHHHSEPRSGQGDRVTLGDLTVIATASASRQLAASPQQSSASPAARPAAGAGGHAGGGAQKMTPEQEQREVDMLARRVLDEVQLLLEVARERTGDPWET